MGQFLEKATIFWFPTTAIKNKAGQILGKVTNPNSHTLQTKQINSYVESKDSLSRNMKYGPSLFDYSYF